MHRPAYEYRTILEHFKGALLQVEEGFRESPDRFVERETRLGLYCVAQRARGAAEPALEEGALHFEVALLHGDEVAHHVAERRDVVFGLARCLPARETRSEEHTSELQSRVDISYD